MCSPDLYIDTFLQLGYNLGQCKDYGFDILMKSEVIEIGSDNITVNYYLKKQLNNISLGQTMKSFPEIKKTPAGCKNVCSSHDFICAQTCIPEIYLNIFAESLNYTEGFCKNLGYNKFLKSEEMNFSHDLSSLNISYYIKEEFKSCIQFYNIINENICEEVCINNYLDSIYDNSLLNLKKGKCEDFGYNIFERTIQINEERNLEKCIFLKEKSSLSLRRAVK